MRDLMLLSNVAAVVGVERWGSSVSTVTPRWRSMSHAERRSEPVLVGKPLACHQDEEWESRSSMLWREAICEAVSEKECHRRSPTTPAARPLAVRRESALSARQLMRYSLREVNMRYGSLTPFVIRSSIRMPMYASARESVNGP